MQTLPESFVISEDKRIIFPDRPAHRSAKLVPPERWSISLIEEIRSVQHVVAKKLECCPVPLIRSRLRYDHHLPAGPLAEFGSVRVALHTEFADGIDTEEHAARSTWLHVVFCCAAVFDAVQQENVLLRAIAGNSEIICSSRVGDAGAASLLRGEIHDAGVERKK